MTETETIIQDATIALGGDFELLQEHSAGTLAAFLYRGRKRSTNKVHEYAIKRLDRALVKWKEVSSPARIPGYENQITICVEASWPNQPNPKEKQPCTPTK